MDIHLDGNFLYLLIVVAIAFLMVMFVMNIYQGFAILMCFLLPTLYCPNAKKRFNHRSGFTDFHSYANGEWEEITSNKENEVVAYRNSRGQAIHYGEKNFPIEEEKLTRIVARD